jgi:apolipoprotein N-acyltransferase
MINKRIPLQLMPGLFLFSVILIIFTTSFSVFSPLIFVIFTSVFKLIDGRKLVEQLIILLFLILTVCIAMFSNEFFIQDHPFLFILISMYFTFLLGMDLIISFYFSKYRYAICIIFGYVLLSRFIFIFSTNVFPFYWTLTMHLLPFMDVISQLILPLLWEALCVALSIVIYSLCLGKLKRNILLQMAGIIFIVICFSGIINEMLEKSELKPGLQCNIIQGAYSKQDYNIVERYPVLGKKIAEKYLGHIEEINNARFVILPESSFPIALIEESEIIQKLKEISKKRNEYIMTGILLEETDNIYNASVLINPEGEIQNVYRKRNTVLFVETLTFTRGIRAETFTVDGHIIAPVICYESIFLLDYFRDLRPELYIVISNDIFAEKTILSRLHQAYSVINARVMGTPLLQVMQNGPSFYVDSLGRLTNLTEPYEQVIGLTVEIR